MSIAGRDRAVRRSQQTSRWHLCPVGSAAGPEEQEMAAVGAGPPGGSSAIGVAAVVVAVVN